MGTWRAGLRVAGFLGMTVAIMPVQWLLIRFGLAGARSLPVRYHRLLCKLIGIKVTVTPRKITAMTACLIGFLPNRKAILSSLSPKRSTRLL